MLKCKTNAYSFLSHEPIFYAPFSKNTYLIPGRSQALWPKLSILAVNSLHCTWLFIKCSSFAICSLHSLASVYSMSFFPKMLGYGSWKNFQSSFFPLARVPLWYLMSFRDCLMKSYALHPLPRFIYFWFWFCPSLGSAANVLLQLLLLTSPGPRLDWCLQTVLVSPQDHPSTARLPSSWDFTVCCWTQAMLPIVVSFIKLESIFKSLIFRSTWFS